MTLAVVSPVLYVIPKVLLILLILLYQKILLYQQMFRALWLMNISLLLVSFVFLFFTRPPSCENCMAHVFL